MAEEAVHYEPESVECGSNVVVIETLPFTQADHESEDGISQFGSFKPPTCASTHLVMNSEPCPSFEILLPLSPPHSLIREVLTKQFGSFKPPTCASTHLVMNSEPCPSFEILLPLSPPHSLIREVLTKVETPIKRSLQNVITVRSLAPQEYRGDDGKLILDFDEEEIPEEEAVCKSCFNIFKEEDILKTKCRCKNALIHKACKKINRCEVCEQEVQHIPVTLLHQPSVIVEVSGQKEKKKSWFSRFKW